MASALSLMLFSILDGLFVTFKLNDLFIDNREILEFWVKLILIALMGGSSVFILHCFIEYIIKQIRRRVDKRLGILFPAIFLGIINFILSYKTFSGRHVVSYRSYLSFAIFLITIIAFWVVFYFYEIVMLRGEDKEEKGLFILLLLLVGAVLWGLNIKIFPGLYPYFHLGLILVSFVAISLALNGIYWGFLMDIGRQISLRIKFSVFLGFFIFSFGMGLPNIIKTYSRFNIRNLIEGRTFTTTYILRLIYLIYKPKETLSILESSDKAKEEGDREHTFLSDNFHYSLDKDFSGYDIYLITIDALRADHLSIYGYNRKTTPFIESLKKNLVVFYNCFTPIPQTSYAITSLFTSNYIYSLWKLPQVSKQQLTIADLLNSVGIITSTFHTPAVYYIDRHLFKEYEKRGFGFIHKKIEYFSDAFSLVAKVDGFLSKVPPEKELFLWVHFFDLHEPYTLHAEYNWGKSDMDRYDSELSYVDHAVSKLFEAISKRKKDFIMIITGDHGEEFKEHGGMFHGTSLYNEQVRVPLLFYSPQFKHRVVKTAVSLIDVTPTILHLLNIPYPPTIRGKPLSYFLFSPKFEEMENYVYSELEDKKMVTDGKYKLIYDMDRELFELYRLDEDPQEKHNIAERFPEVVRRLKGMIESWVNSISSFELRPVKVGENIKEIPPELAKAKKGDIASLSFLSTIIEDGNYSIGVRSTSAKLLYEKSRCNQCNELRNDGRLITLPQLYGWILLCCGKCNFEQAIVEKLEELFLIENLPKELRNEIALFLGEHGVINNNIIETYSEIIKNMELDPQLRQRAIALVGKYKIKKLLPELKFALNHLSTRPYVFRAMADIGTKKYINELRRFIKIERLPHIREIEIEAMVRLKDRGILPLLLSLLKEELTPPSNTLKALVELEAIPLYIKGVDFTKVHLQGCNCNNELCYPQNNNGCVLKLKSSIEGKSFYLLYKIKDEGEKINIKLNNKDISIAMVPGWNQYRVEFNEKIKLNTIWFNLSSNNIGDSGIRAIVAIE